MASKGAEYKAGVVILLGLIVLGFGIFLVSGGADQFKDKKSFTILFKNGGGVGSGNTVYLAGRKVGTVTSVTEREDSLGGERGTFVAVEIEVFADSRVHKDSECTVSKTVTGIVAVNMEYGASNELAEPGAKLRGRKLASFEDAIDQGTALIEDGRGMVQQVNEILAELKKDVEALNIAELRGGVSKLLDQLNATAVKLDGLIENADGEAKTILTSARNAIKNFEDVSKDVREDWKTISTRIESALKNAESSMAELDAILKENRPSFKLAVQNLTDATQRFAPTLEKIETLVQSAQGLMIDVRPKLSSGLRAASKAFKNFEAVTEDLRTAPWKLINEPSQTEVLEVYLYNAARNFVKSAEDIRAVLDELDTLRKKDVLDESMKGRIEELTAKLELSLKNYDKREKELVRLIGTAKNGEKK